MSAVTRSQVLAGRVSHSRLAPTPHAFAYRMSMLRLDLDELEALDAGRWLFGTRPWRLARLDAADFLGIVPARRSARDTAAALRAAALDVLAAHGVTAGVGRIELVGHVRVAGYVFNPVAFFVCYADGADVPMAVIADVHNTYGERHAYVVPIDGAHTPFVDKKVFHVSPFFSLDGSYRFAFAFAGGAIDAQIDLLRGGQPLFVSRLRLHGTPCSDRALAAALLRWPVNTVRVIVTIHWEAWRLWRKGLLFRDKPVYDPAAARATEP